MCGVTRRIGYRLSLAGLLMTSLPAAAMDNAAGGGDEHTIALWLFDDPPYPNAILTDAGIYQHDLRLRSGYAKWWQRAGG